MEQKLPRKRESDFPRIETVLLFYNILNMRKSDSRFVGSLLLVPSYPFLLKHAIMEVNLTQARRR